MASVAHRPMETTWLDRLAAYFTEEWGSAMYAPGNSAIFATISYRHSLATGGRLRPAVDAGVFETFDAQCSLRLRDPSEARPSAPDATME